MSSLFYDQSGKGSKADKNGFTIIELLIAITIFSIILLAMVYGMISFFTSYDKSLVSSSTQSTVQNISNTIEQSIKYSAAASATTPAALPIIAPSGPPNYFPGLLCVGSDEFAFYLGDSVGTTEIPGGHNYALYELPITSGTCPANPEVSDPADWAKGVSLLGDNMRLINFSVTSLTSPADEWAIDVKIAYTSGGLTNGDDLLCDPQYITHGPAGNCGMLGVSLTSFSYSPNDISCKSSVGTQFCDVAELQSTVESRLN